MKVKKSPSSQKVKFIRNSNRNVWVKIQDGIRAIIDAARIEKSIQNQLWGAVAMLATLILLQPAIFWWGLCLFGSTMCLTMEFFNTSIEQLADYLNPEYDPRIGSIKDLAAGGAIMASIGTFICGVLMILDTFALLG
jgi:diacylglycerol kinase (ATP)